MTLKYESLSLMTGDNHKGSGEKKQLYKPLPEQEAMLREIHHRVKNNLQLVSSLLSLQAASSGDPRLKSQLLVTQNRVKSIALIHHLLYRNGNSPSINAEEYLYGLSSQLLASYGETGSRIRVRIGAQDIFFTIETAVPFGLLMNELITNSLRHAFPGGREGGIHITLSKAEEDAHELEYCDDGIGKQLTLVNGHIVSLGLSLIETLVKQLEGTIEKIPSEGTAYKVNFRGINYQTRLNVS
jgi:two-component sensor histidine kinase